MKESNKKKPVKTVLDGVWEASHKTTKDNKSTKTTDLQGNGYPSNKQSK